jgi:hypothetical protein
MKKSGFVLLGAFIAGFLLVQGVTSSGLFDFNDDRSAEAKALVEIFGERLQLVPLMGAPEVAAQAMREHYASIVHENLLEQWMYNPLAAPGRLTSSPYPDRIEVASVEKREGGTYLARGAIVEETSDGESGRTDVEITIAEIDSGLVIVAFTASEPEATSN